MLISERSKEMLSKNQIKTSLICFCFSLCCSNNFDFNLFLQWRGNKRYHYKMQFRLSIVNLKESRRKTKIEINRFLVSFHEKCPKMSL